MGPTVSTTVADVVVPNGRSGAYRQQKTTRKHLSILRPGRAKRLKASPIHPGMQRR